MQGGQNTFSHSMSTNLSDISYIDRNQLLEVKKNCRQAIKNLRISNKNQNKYSSALFFCEQNSMYMTTSIVDDYPTAMSSHGTSRITNYDVEILTGSVAGPSNTYRYKRLFLN